MRRPSLIIAFLVLGSAAVWWGLGNHRLQEVRLQTRALQSELAEKQSALTEAGALVSRLRQDIAAAERSAEFSAVQTRKVVGQIAQVTPDRLYAKPPAQLPDWNPESPYVWLPKDIVPRFPFSSIEKDGRLNPALATVLVIDDGTRRRLDESMTGLMREYQEIEATQAEFTDEHLPGIAESDGERLSVIIRPMPEEGRKIQERFEDEVLRSLGQQRGQLVLDSADEWMDTAFSQGGSEPRTISVQRRADGTYNVSIKAGFSWFNTGGIRWEQLKHDIPAYLLPSFAALGSEPADAKD